MSKRSQLGIRSREWQSQTWRKQRHLSFTRGRYRGRILIGAIIAFTLPIAAKGDPVVLDFDEIPAVEIFTGDPVPESNRLSDQYLTTHGIFFRSSTQWVTVNVYTAAPSLPNMITGATADGHISYLPANPVVATFWDPDNPTLPAITNLVSVTNDLNASSSLNIRLEAYDLDGNLVDFDEHPDTAGWILSVSSPNIHEVRYLGTNDSGGASIDDFTFNTPNSVPTVSVWGMLALVLCVLVAGTLVFRRRAMA